MPKDSSVYSVERAKYKQQFPRSRMHHMHPTSRHGSDSEFNLFPWNEKSHSCWHWLFFDLTLREASQLLREAHTRIWDSSAETLSAEWMQRYLYQFKKAVQKDILHEHRIEHWQQWWLEAFGGDSLESALYIVRSMMLCMVFGHHAFTREVFDTRRLRELLKEIPADGDRAWAFRMCFGKCPSRRSYGCIKKKIRRIRVKTARARR